jgi:hypothetical protein
LAGLDPATRAGVQGEALKAKTKCWANAEQFGWRYRVDARIKSGQGD